MEVGTHTAVKDVPLSDHALTVFPVLGMRNDLNADALKGIRVEELTIKIMLSLGFTRQTPLSKAARSVGK